MFMMCIYILESSFEITNLIDSFSIVLGQGDMAVSNTIGSNVFDVLIGLALPWFLMTACVNPGSYVHINSNGMIFSVLLLFLSIIFTVSSLNIYKILVLNNHKLYSVNKAGQII